MDKLDQFYLVREDVLPAAMVKALEAKAMLERGKAKTVYEAVQAVGISRSAFYKYRDGVFAFHKVEREKIMTLFFYLEDHSGTLSKLLGEAARAGCNVLTIHQSIPLQGQANVSLSVDTSAMTMGIEELLETFKRIPAIEKVEIVGTGA